MADKSWIETLESHDGVELYCQYYPSPDSVGAIMTVHDYGQHSGAYQKAHDQFVKQHFSIYTLDLRGHGKSPGDRASIDHFDDFLEDLDLLYARVKDREPERPVFLLGQGMGALIAMRFALTRRPTLSGMILCGRLPELPVNSKERLLAQYAGVLLPHVEANKEARELLLSPALSGALKDDALSYRGAVKAKTLLELNEATHSLDSEHAFLSFPVLCLSPEKDLPAMERLYENILSHDKTLLPYAGQSQQPLLHPERDQILGEVIEWCEAHLEKLVDDDEWDDEDDSL
ncbi:MAG: alpha/beta hydrolase [Oligoflexus sp.]|nr:alpha/beta hydrolase [Oligoflexus sp.]